MSDWPRKASPTKNLLERTHESQECLLDPLRSWSGHPVFAIHPVGRGKRAASWPAGASTLRQSDQRVLRAGCAGLLRSAGGVYAAGRQAASDEAAVGADCGFMFGGSEPGAAAVSVSARTGTREFE